MSKKIADLEKKIAGLKAKGLQLIEAAEKDDREFTDDEATTYEAIEADIEAAEADLKTAHDLAERRRNMQSTTALGNTVRDPNPETTGGFADIGEFAVAVHQAVQAQQIGGAVDSRLVAVTGTHQGGGGAGEGFSLPPQFRDEVWEVVTEVDDFGPLIDEEPTSRREVKIDSDETTPWGAAGIKSYWRGEAKQMTPSELSDEGRTVPLHELFTLALASEELLEDAPRLNNRLTRKAGQAIAFKKSSAIVEGTGVGMPLGWMDHPAQVVVAKEGAQLADTIVALNVINMLTRLQTIPGDRPFWMVNQDTLPQLMTMTVGDKPIWMPPSGDLVDAPGGFLLGKPIRFSEFCESLGNKGDIQLVSPKGYYGVRRSSGPKFATSIHLYFDFAIQAFRWMFRYGGQPHLSAPISPNKGNNTRSHFVTLAERA